jgi:hypothetical protein
MRAISFIVSLAALPNLTFAAGQDLPDYDLARDVEDCLVIYDIPLATLQQNLTQKIHELRDAGVDPGGLQFKEIPPFGTKTAITSPRGIYSKSCILHWIPVASRLNPKNPDMKRGEISGVHIYIGRSLKNEQRSFLHIWRIWSWVGAAYIPKTNIRLFSNRSFNTPQLLKSDVDWAFSLRGDGAAAVFLDESPGTSKHMALLDDVSVPLPEDRDKMP